ncbi:hypothetical protein Tco_1071812, partial [Tanacetum coccineum]
SQRNQRVRLSHVSRQQQVKMWCPEEHRYFFNSDETTFLAGAHVYNVNSTSSTTEGNNLFSSRDGILASNPRKRTHQNALVRSVQSEGSPSKRVRRSTLRVGNRRVTTITCGSGEGCSFGQIGDISPVYDDLGDCGQQCRHCGAVSHMFGEVRAPQPSGQTILPHLHSESPLKERNIRDAIQQEDTFAAPDKYASRLDTTEIIS